MRPIAQILMVLLCPALLLAQKPAEIGLITDNDLYTSPINDHYYTAGFEFYYRYLGNADGRNHKRITDFRIGQYIYNPQSVRAADINVHDRPFAGYLFAEAGINNFYQKHDVLKLSLQAGVVGPESGAEQVQEGLHKLVGYPTVQGWQYQIPTTLSLQASAFFSRRIYPSRFMHRFEYKTDLHLQAEANAGTIWTSAAIGALGRISLRGPLEDFKHSVMHNAALEHDPEERKKRRELFIYASPQLQYMQYDATILGSRFSDTEPPVTFPLIPFRFNAEVGIKYRRENWNFSYSFNYRGKELSNNVITGFYYGSILIGYYL